MSVPTSAPRRKSKTLDSETTRSSLDLLYHISRELTTVLDIHAVLQRVVFLSMQTVRAHSGSIIVLDENGTPVESVLITGEQVHDHTTQRLRVTLEKGLAGWVMRNRIAALVADTSRDDRWMPRYFENEPPAAGKSAASAPLLVHDRLVGVMTLVHNSLNFFTKEHLSLVQAIADQAGFAVLNAHLYAISQRQARVMTALVESAATITGSLNLEDVLSRILENISRALRVQAVSLALMNPEKQELVFRAATGWMRNEPMYNLIALGKGIAGWVAKEGRGLIIPEVHKDLRFDPEINLRTGLEVRSVACAPIRYRGQVLGILEAINPLDKVFDPDALQVLTGIGSLAGGAIHQAQLFERLQAAHKSYRRLFDDSIDPILITDWDGCIQEANHRAILFTEFDKETLRSMNIRQLHTIDEDLIGGGFEGLSAGKTSSYESLLRPHGPHDVPIQVYVRQVEIEGISYIQWILRDITERKNLDNLRNDLISMIYHDLRSPLTNIVSSLDALDIMLPKEGETLRPLVNITMRSVERIQRLTNSLLDISHLEAGQPIGDRTPAPIANLTNDAIEIVIPVAKNKQLEITSTVSPKLPLVLVDADMIRRVLTNLLENAIKFTPPKGKIEVGAVQEANWLNVWVQDTGPGIPVAEQERIFEKFARLNNDDYSKGFGLGLAYCRLAVQGHGGQIWVKSEPGAGARFIFTLPVVEEDIACER